MPLFKSLFGSSKTVGMRPSKPVIEMLEERRLLSGVAPVAITTVPSGGVIILPPPIHIVNQGTLTGLTISADTGKQFTGDVALWKQSVVIEPLVGTQLRASIQWGDGATTPGNLVYDPAGVTHVRGTHTYIKPGTFVTTITLTQVPIVTPGQPVPKLSFVLASANGKAVVTGQATSGVTIHPIVNQSFTGTVAKLNFSVPPNQGIGGYAATIDWGDGTTSAGKFISPLATGDSDVTGTHTYKKTGTFKVHVVVSFGPVPGSGALFPTRILAQINSTAIVTSPTPIFGSGTGVTLNLTAGQPFTGSVGNFTSGFAAASTAVPQGLSAGISWGDGTTSTGKIVSNGKGGYSVEGTHTYAKAGKFTIHVSVTLRPVVMPGQPLPQFIALIANWDSTANVA